MTSDSSFPPGSNDIISQLVATTDQLGACVADLDPGTPSGERDLAE